MSTPLRLSEVSTYTLTFLLTGFVFYETAKNVSYTHALCVAKHKAAPPKAGWKTQVGDGDTQKGSMEDTGRRPSGPVGLGRVALVWGMGSGIPDTPAGYGTASAGGSTLRAAVSGRDVCPEGTGNGRRAMRTETKVLRTTGWGPISDVTDEMVAAHAAKHPDPVDGEGAWLLRGRRGVNMIWRDGSYLGLLSGADYDECCPLDSRGVQVSITVEVPVHRSVADVREDILSKVVPLTPRDISRQIVSDFLDEYAEAVLAERGDK